MRLLPFAALAVLGQAQAAPAIAHLPALQTATLPNGLQIAVLPIDSAPVVSVQVWYHAGSKDDARNRRGTARMFEYLMFEGSEHVRTGGHAQLIGNLGGFVAGRVEEDASHYSNTLPSDNLDVAIRLEADRMRNLMFRKEAVDAAREALVSQIQQSEQAPITKPLEHLLSIAFTHHPYAWTAAGVATDLNAMTIDDVKKFYDAYYQPNDAMLVVVGKTTLDQVKASAEKYFGPIAKGPDHAPIEEEPEQQGSRREQFDPGPVGLSIVGWHIPAAKAPDFYALQLGALILGVGDGSRLKTRFRVQDPKTKQPLAIDGGIDMRVHEAPGVLMAIGAYRDGSRADAVEAAINDEVKKLGKDGPSSDELRRAKNQVESGFVFSLERVDGLGETIGRSWILTGDPSAFATDVDRVEKVTSSDVQKAVKTYLQPDRATVVVVPPKQP